MPYINQEDREYFVQELLSLADALGRRPEENMAGNFNYCITRLMHSVLEAKDRVSYRDFNEMIGALECCKLDFYSEQVRPYEEVKKKQNGDV